MLSARNLAKRYKKKPVVSDVSIDVNRGDIVGLLGPNGAGKTTCFYMMVGLIRCDRGEIHIDRKNIADLPVHARAKMGIGYLPQEPSIFRSLSVEKNILAILETRKSLSRSQQKEQLEQLMEELGISHISQQMGFSLSGGERRRVEIARALAANPNFILLDEPFAGVDPISVAEIQKIVVHLKNRGIGVLVTDHHVRETLGICDHAYILAEGVVLAEGTSKEILANRKVQEVYLGENFTL